MVTVKHHTHRPPPKKEIEQSIYTKKKKIMSGLNQLSRLSSSEVFWGGDEGRGGLWEMMSSPRTCARPSPHNNNKKKHIAQHSLMSKLRGQRVS